MIRRLAGAAAWVALTAVASCGGRNELAHSILPDAAADDFPPHAACASSDGVRICGGANDCPWLPAPECPGFGCGTTYDTSSLAPTGTGVCWTDAPDKGYFRCGACNPGDVCIQRAVDGMVCVSPRVCEALWDMGVRNVCRYADLSPYDHRTVRAPTGSCPSRAACGGSCLACPGRCTGISPGRAFGACNSIAPGKSGDFPDSYLECNHNGTIYDKFECRLADPYNAVCGVFRPPPGASPADAFAARRHGICLGRGQCLTLGKLSPGMDCYDGDTKIN